MWSAELLAGRVGRYRDSVYRVSLRQNILGNSRVGAQV